MTVIHAVISVLLTIEMLFVSVFSGVNLKNITMPDVKSGECSSQVDPFIGTGSEPWTCAMVSPAACMPFGSVRVGADTCSASGVYLFKTNTSGYYYEHSHLRGFSWSRLSGTGVNDYGMFRVTPALGRERSGVPSPLTYSHKYEKASPGYYAVYLPKVAALAEMTANVHSGMQRYTFDSGKNAMLYIDAASHLGSCSAKDARVSIDPSTGEISGYARLYGNFSDRFGGLPMYFYAVTDREIASYTLHTADGDDSSGNEISGDDAGICLNFGDIKGKPLTLSMGISFVSGENAKENLLTECGGKTFDEVRQEAADAWEGRLSAIKIKASDEVKKLFYTGLYHAMIMPTDFTDVSGEYLGFDKKVHIAEGFTYRTDMSLWDTFRNVHSLYTLIAPDIQNDCIQSLLLMAEQGGTLPRWPMGAGYTGSMFGNPANVLLAESEAKGFAFDLEKALDYMIKSSETFDNIENREFGELYNELGYVPYDETKQLYSGFSVSRTLEYSWEDACIARIAEKAGRSEDAEKYALRSTNYKNVWDSETKYFRARNTDGSWGPLKPNMTSFYDEALGTKISRGYCEGSARQWRFNVLQDIDSMIELFGSKEYFVDELEDFMKDASAQRAAIDPGAGYWAGNQHDIHVPYLFSDAGRADLTQKWVRWALKNRYSADIDGLDGNDDGGTISSWYVFSALGFYPLAGTEKYWLGSPCIESAEISLPNGNTLTITADNQSDDNVYVKSVTLNGEAIEGNYITHEMLLAGGKLVFEMKGQ